MIITTVEGSRTRIQGFLGLDLLLGLFFFSFIHICCTTSYQKGYRGRRIWRQGVSPGVVSCYGCGACERLPHFTFRLVFLWLWSGSILKCGFTGLADFLNFWSGYQTTWCLLCLLWGWSLLVLSAACRRYLVSQVVSTCLGALFRVRVWLWQVTNKTRMCGGACSAEIWHPFVRDVATVHRCSTYI